jgi:hypothetical protein
MGFSLFAVSGEIILEILAAAAAYELYVTQT